MMGTPGMMGMGGMMMVLWFLIFVVVVAFVFYLGSRYPRRNSGASTHADDALRILRERYARGEIDSATYEKMKDDLK